MDRTQKRRRRQLFQTSSFRNVGTHQIKRILTALLLWSCLALSAVSLKAHAQQDPEIFSYEELVELHEQPVLSPRLQSKLNSLLTTPFVKNDPTGQSISPLRPLTPELGRILRVASWNIERGLEYEAIVSALGGRESFSATLRGAEKKGRTAKDVESILQQAEMLRNADVIVLNEVDWGMKRTAYRNVVADLAAALNMNYAYGVEFVEVDPLSMGLEKFDGAKAEDKTALVEYTKVDTARYKGLHGTAILSRYRLENVRVIPFVYQPHDWYLDEKNGVAKLESGKREASEKVFLEKVLREVRRGGRMMMLADLVDPALPLAKVTIVATHLESRTKPANRARQLQELLTQIRDIKNPVIVAGDMNTSNQDMTPTSILREIKKRLGSKSFWAHQGIKYATGAGLVFDVVVGALHRGRTHADPTVRNIPLVSTNAEGKFFSLLKDFRFGDGGAFDFRGGEGRAVGDRTGPLANSNQRGQKGFITTYEVDRTLSFVGRYKLDWIFVKPPDLTQPDDVQQPYRFAPHYGRTLVDLNESIKDHISDHNPIIVDLPLDEPAQAGNKPERKKTKAS